jgi:thymidylate kinase
MFVIVEGPDRVGKDTLIQGIKNYFTNLTFHELHYSAVKAQDVKEYSKKMYTEFFEILEMFNNKNMSCIANRSHIGEAVYGPIYRKYSGDYIFDIEKEFKSKDFFNKLNLIVLVDNPENLIKRDDGLSFSTPLEKKETEIQHFKDAFIKSNIENKILININGLTIEDVRNKVIDFLQE